MSMLRVKSAESKRGIRGRSLSGHGERLGEASAFLRCGLLASVFDQEAWRLSIAKWVRLFLFFEFDAVNSHVNNRGKKRGRNLSDGCANRAPPLAGTKPEVGCNLQMHRRTEAVSTPPTLWFLATGLI